jgi:hypothetical protein
MFLRESGVMLGPEFKTRSKDLYAYYKVWCIDNGHKVQSSTGIRDDWLRLGLESYRAMGQTVWRGVGLPISQAFLLAG